jgi:hypothetical protein
MKLYIQSLYIEYKPNITLKLYSWYDIITFRCKLNVTNFIDTRDDAEKAFTPVQLSEQGLFSPRWLS